MKWLVALKKIENKYLVLDDVDENKEVLKKYEKVWEGVKKEIETINGGERVEYGTRFKKKLDLSLMMTFHWINLQNHPYWQ